MFLFPSIVIPNAHLIRDSQWRTYNFINNSINRIQVYGFAIVTCFVDETKKKSKSKIIVNLFAFYQCVSINTISMKIFMN